VARLTRHRADFNNAFCDFGDFDLKQTLNQLRVGPAQNDFDLVARVADVEDQAPHTLAGLVLFARDLFAAGHEAFRSTDLHDQRAAFVTLGHAGDQFADAVDVFVVDAGAFVFAETRDHDLLGGLRGDTAEVFEGDVFFATPDVDLAVEPIDLTGEVFGIDGVEVLAGGGHHGLFEVYEQGFFFDVAISRDRVDEA